MDRGAVPTSLTEEIWEYIGYYKQASKSAIAAGIDLVEMYGTRGYLAGVFI